MGMAAFRINDEERQARGSEATEQVAECPTPELEAEATKAATVTAKKSTSKG